MRKSKTGRCARDPFDEIGNRKDELIYPKESTKSFLKFVFDEFPHPKL